MKAAPAAQLTLLEVQGLDAAMDRLAHRRAALPELAELDAVEGRLVALRDELVRAQTLSGDLGREQTRAEGDVDMVRNRMHRDQGRLDSGQVSSPRELQNLQSELVSLRRRRDELEDQVLEIMERREVVDSVATRLEEEQAGLAVQQQQVVARRDAAFAEIDSDAAQAGAQRVPLWEQIPAELTILYEKIRASSGGVGAAALFRGRCQGCRLPVSPVELAAIKAAPPEEVVRCEECRRILVRTTDSGL